MTHYAEIPMLKNWRTSGSVSTREGTCHEGKYSLTMEIGMSCVTHQWRDTGKDGNNNFGAYRQSSARIKFSGSYRA